MILSYKLCINIEPVKIGIKITQINNKTIRKYLNDKIQFTFFFCLPCDRWVNAQMSHTHINYVTPLKIVSLFRLRTAFNTCHFESNTIRTQLNKFIRTRSSVVVQMSEVETGIIFLFMNVKRFKRSFSVVLFYIQLYTKSLGSANLKTFFRVGRITGSRGIFLIKIFGFTSSYTFIVTVVRVRV